ncbi:potassium channel family protein [Kitasatospora sp. NPDC051853]|uniref:potassium channel family protein n=1 Tax=Kitasatospora sp. NPDC051853 TaxID=3364058 RepID=UPI0037897576
MSGGTDAPRVDRVGWLYGLGGATALLVGYFTVPLGVFGPHHPVPSWLTFAGALTVLAGFLLREIRREYLALPGRPAMAILLLSALTLVVFASTYYALADEFTGLSTRIDALYFTVVTLATVGFGDVTPSGQAARVVVMLQILYTLVFLTAGATTVSRRLHERMAERATSRAEEPGRRRRRHHRNEES